jgi:hypothetical protein
MSLIAMLSEGDFIILDVIWKDAQNAVDNLFLVAVLIAKMMKTMKNKKVLKML